MTDFIKGMVSSIGASAIVYPVDVIKTQYQINQVSGVKTIKTTNLISNIYKTRGLHGFYRGLSPHLCTYPIFWGVYFQTTNQKTGLSSLTKYEYVNKVIVSLYGSSIASTIANPLFVIKTRLQTESLKSKNSINILKLSKDIYKFEGIGGYFKGLNSTIVGNTKLAIQFPLYDYIYEKNGSVFISSLIAKTLSSTILYPTDLIRVNQRDSVKQLKFIDVAKNIFKKNGLRGFYNGCLLYNAVSIPNFVLLMVFREMLS